VVGNKNSSDFASEETCKHFWLFTCMLWKMIVLKFYHMEIVLNSNCWHATDV
jgi:hypothetical protein